MILNEVVTLTNGTKMPKLGYGTWMINNEDVVQLVKDALEIGYRHIDTAEAYMNEEGVGKAIRDSGVDREDIFVTTKLEGDIKNYLDAVKAIQESLNKLDIGYIDLMLIHSPQPWAHFREADQHFREADQHFFEGNLEAWRALEEAYEAGHIRAIGVSNFDQVDLENLIQNGSVKPMVNQVLAHITNLPMDVINFSQDNDIIVQAYSPIAHGAILNHPTVQEIAQHYHVSPAQLSLRFVIQLGLVALPKSTNKEHIQSNTELDFEISEAHMEELKALPLIEHYGEDHDMPVFKSQY